MGSRFEPWQSVSRPCVFLIFLCHWNFVINILRTHIFKDWCYCSVGQVPRNRTMGQRVCVFCMGTSRGSIVCNIFLRNKPCDFYSLVLILSWRHTTSDHPPPLSRTIPWMTEDNLLFSSFLKCSSDNGVTCALGLIPLGWAPPQWKTQERGTESFLMSMAQ